MTISLAALAAYALGVGILFLTPGPVWAAIIARALSGGFQAAWPLALGVVVGDVFWPILAIFGVTWLVSIYADFLLVLRYGGAVMLAIMGLLLIRDAGRAIEGNSRLTTPGAWAGFSAGVLIILGNPKAILFYMGFLPGFFDLSTVTLPDIVAIASVSMVVPLIGNLAMAVFVDRARKLIRSETGLKRINTASGVSLILVGIGIALS